MEFALSMEKKEKALIMLRWGLTLKKLLDHNRAVNLSIKNETGKKDKTLIDSFGKLEKQSEITKSTLVNISKGRINAASTTWTAILEAFKMNLSGFGRWYDEISETELDLYKREIEEESRKK